MSVHALLELKAVTRCFGAFTALDAVNISVQSGEILALLGENGAGKSTLLSIVAGVLTPSEGDMLLDGARVRWMDARAAAGAGIGVVYQHFRLVPSLSIAQNLALAARDGGTLFRAAVWEKRAEDWAKALGWKLDGAALIHSLGVGERQRVEILKALFCGRTRGADTTRLLLLDEPTANLTPDEALELFRVVRELRSQGCTIVFVSHKLSEVMMLCDRVVVLRRGKVVGEKQVAHTSTTELAALMVGSAAKNDQEECPAAADAVSPPSLDSATLGSAALASTSLELKSLSTNRLQSMSICVRAGEIVALAGVDGNGQRELVDVLAGLRIPTEGRMDAVGHIAIIPLDRNREGLISSLDIAENYALSTEFRVRFRKRSALGTRFDWKSARVRARDLIEQFDVRTPFAAARADRALASQLSGGNAQKVVLARALSTGAPVVVAADPTRGLDIHAARFVHAQLRAAATRGAAVLLITSDLDEALQLGDRLGALYDGRVLPDELLPGGATRECVGALMGGTLPAPSVARSGARSGVKLATPTGAAS